MTVAVVLASYVLATPGVNAPNDAGGPSVRSPGSAPASSSAPAIATVAAPKPRVSAQPGLPATWCSSVAPEK